MLDFPHSILLAPNEETNSISIFACSEVVQWGVQRESSNAQWGCESVTEVQAHLSTA